MLTLLLLLISVAITVIARVVTISRRGASGRLVDAGRVVEVELGLRDMREEEI